MRRKKIKFLDQLQVEISQNYHSENMRKTLMVNVFGVLGGSIIFFFLIHAALNQIWFNFLILSGFAFFLSVVVFYLKKNPLRYQYIGTLILILSFCMGIYFFMYPNVGLGPIWQYIFIPMTFMLIGHRKAMAFNFMMLLLILSIYFLAPALQEQFSYGFIWRYAFIYSILTMIMFFYEYVRFSMDDQLEKNQEHLKETLAKVMDQNEEITIQSEMLQKIISEMRKFSMIAENTENSVIIVDPSGGLEWVNPAFTKLFGYNPMEKPRSEQNIFHITQGIEGVWQECLQHKKTLLYESSRKTISGTEVWLQSTLSPLLDDSNRLIRLALIETNITRLKQIEKELILLNQTLENRVHNEVQRNREKDHVLLQQNRQAALGELLSNIAHQWRQPLNIVAINIQNIFDAFQFGELSGTYLEEKVEKCMDYINSMSETIEDFRTYFKTDYQKSQFCINNIIQKGISFIEPSLREQGINIFTHFEKELHVYGYPNQYMQAILNIISNARDSLILGKTDNPQVLVSGYVDENQNKVVKVYNNGPGIEPDVAVRIFEPYFSTKSEVQRNQGLGLFMARNIIENNMDGTLSFQNQDIGVEFLICINS